MILLDTHQHLIYRERIGYAWSDELPALRGRDFSVADYQALTAEIQMKPGIFMETAADDTDYRQEAHLVAKLAADSASAIAGLVASCRPENGAEFKPWIEAAADFPIVGFRRILHVVPDDVSRSDEFRRNVRRLGEMDYTFDMCFRAEQLGIAAELARACDNTQLILDHCGVPDVAAGAIEPWRVSIKALARLPNVACKISGVLAYCAPGDATLDAVRPYIECVMDSFGPDRLVWGSDWPVVNTRSGLPEWIAMFKSLCQGLSRDEAAAIGHENAARIYGLGG